MNRKDLQELRIHSGFPALTLITTCEKGTVRTALEKLLKEAEDSHWTKTVADRCEELVGRLTCPTKPFKSAFFIDKHGGKAFVVPPEVPNDAVCDTTFHLDALTATLNRLMRYWVIDCTGKAPRLLEGVEGLFIDPHSSCVFVENEDDEAFDLFDRCIGGYLEQDRLPICIVGGAKEAQRFELLAPYTSSITAHVPHLDDVWPAMQRWHAASVEKTLSNVAAGRPDVDFLINAHAIIDAARQGQIAVLALEEEFARQGCEHPVTRSVLINESCPPGYLTIELIDEIIENTRAKGGMVFLLPAGSITQYGRLVAFTSWR